MTSTYNACFGEAEYAASISDPTRRGLTGRAGWFSDILIGNGAVADVDGVVVEPTALLGTVPVPVSDDWEPEIYTDALRQAGWEPLTPLPTRPVRQFAVRSLDGGTLGGVAAT